jgi:hypothetical protein
MRGTHLSEDEVIEKIRAVTMNDIESILPTVCTTEDISAAVVGRTENTESAIRKALIRQS